MSKEFFQNFRKFYQNFEIICVSRPNAQKVNAEFVKFFEKISYNNGFFAIFVRKFSQKFPANSAVHPNAQKLNAWFVKLF